MKSQIIAVAMLIAASAQAQPYVQLEGLPITQSSFISVPLEPGHVILESQLAITNTTATDLNNLYIVVVSSIMSAGVGPNQPCSWNDTTGRWSQSALSMSGGMSAVAVPGAIPERLPIAWTNLPRTFVVLGNTTRFAESDRLMSWYIGDLRRGSTAHATLYFDLRFNPSSAGFAWFVDSRAVHVPVPLCAADVADVFGRSLPDGGITIDDLILYCDLFASGDPHADIDDGSGTNTPDGGVTIEDLLHFLVRFEAGC